MSNIINKDFLTNNTIDNYKRNPISENTYRTIIWAVRG
ncbi:MAG: hypothetical protein K0S41_2379 [Anaerocolumna sp.]|jgi:hypothetical protein|nr:hypothetical protein [Anaerocolumna sp.]